MSARPIPMNHRSLTGFLAGRPGDPGIPFESTLERDLYTILAFDLNVDKVIAQPLKLQGSNRVGEQVTYFPDTLVTYRKDIIPALWMKPMLIEVKYRRDLWSDWPELKPKFKLARAYARENGCNFKILTEVEIRTPFLKNAKFLLPYLHGPCIYEFETEIILILDQLREATPEMVLAALRKTAMARAELLPSLWRLITIRQVGMDMTMPLTMQSHIWRQGPEEGWSRWAIKNSALFSPSGGLDLSSANRCEEKL